MAKRTLKPQNDEVAKRAAEPQRKMRGGSRARGRREGVASEMASGQEKAAGLSDALVGIAYTDGSLQGPAAGSNPASSEPSAEDIRMRAYHRYLERGGGHGMDFEDWLEAERELKTRP